MEDYLEEIKERYEKNQKELDEVDKRGRELYDKKRALIKEFCEGLCKKYAEFINKFVKVKFKDSANNECEVDGFLLGFSYQMGFHTGIYPDIAKRKKDGSPSKLLYSTWDIKHFMCIVSIEIINEI